MNRRGFMAGTAASALLPLAISRAAAQTASPVMKLVFPFGAGGGGDALTRLMAEQLAPALGRTIIVENRTGADGRIGIQSVKSAAADGNTFLMTTGPTMWMMPLVHKAPGYDPHTDFEPISQLALFEFCIAIANNIEVKTVAELVAWIKANPTKATFGVPGAGTLPAFAGASFAKAVGVDMRRLPYRGGAPAMIDLVGGQIPIVVGTVADALQQHRAGTIRIVAVCSEKRSPFLADVPTLIESGFSISADAWYGLWAPAKTPRETVERLNAAAVGILKQPEIQQRLEKIGLIATGTAPARLTELMRDNAKRWAPVITETGYKLE